MHRERKTFLTVFQIYQVRRLRGEKKLENSERKGGKMKRRGNDE